MKYTLPLLTTTLLLLAACSGGNDEHNGTHVHGEEITYTHWTDSLELFVAYEQPVHTGNTTFYVHLTRLTDWSPVNEATVVLYADGPDGERRGTAAEQPVQPGVYAIRLPFPVEGTYAMMLISRVAGVIDTCVLPSVTIGQDETSENHADDHSVPDAHVTFSKEEQWEGRFATGVAVMSPVRSTITATAEIQAAPGKIRELSAPVSGTVSAASAHAIPTPGSWVNAGSLLALLAPNPGDVQGLARVRAEYLDAKADYERVLRLHENGAVSDKRLDNARHRYDAARAGYAALEKAAGDADSGTSAMLELRAPVSGFLESIGFRPGQHITAGQTLFVIADPSRLLLRAAVPVAHAGELGDIIDAWFSVEGFDRPFRISELNGRLLSRGNVIDPDTRTLRVTFVFDNPGNALAIGLFADVRLESGGTRDVVTVPREAVIDEGDGVHSVFVQHGGEHFARRAVTPGYYGESLVEIIEGLRAGERIVTRGTHALRLAAMSGAIPDHGHTH
ncbi:MAG: efflux RND transporter periplasmic adaptor subunit [Bacteroidetes bacterium]|nr:efflux RND transporter periplasmic adaptor subunit [Bacteroidota bacterium]